MAASMNQNAKILIVDDMPEILESLRRTLNLGDYDLTCIDDPEQAIGLLHNQSFDVLLSDVDMPEVDGHVVMQYARTLQPSMIRIFLTGSGEMAAAVKAINEGEVHRFVRKPYRPEELRSVVAEALERKEELDRVSAVSARAQRKRQLYAQLEVEHPGITEIMLLEGGVYVVGTDTIDETARSIGMSDPTRASQ